MTYRLPQGAICVLNDRCKNKNLLSIGARYFLVLEHSDPYIVETVPVFTTKRNSTHEIRINKESYWISIDPHIMIPFDLLWLAGSKQLNNPKYVLATIKEIQKRPKPQKNEKQTNQQPLIRIGDVCTPVSAYKEEFPENYYLVIKDCPSKKVLVVPISTKISNEEKEKGDIIYCENYRVSISDCCEIPTGALLIISRNHVETAKRALAYTLKRSTSLKSAYLAKEQKDVSEGKTLYIYKGKTSCHRRNHPIIQVAATFYNQYGRKIKLDVEYCQTCELLMMNYISFDARRKEHGVLIRDLRMISDNSFDGEVHLADESPLKLCGYSVSQSLGLTESSRHYILAKIIHDDILSKTEVIHYLEHFIHMNGVKEGNGTALIKWRNDLDFVHEYNIDIQPEFYITAIQKY